MKVMSAEEATAFNQLVQAINWAALLQLLQTLLPLIVPFLNQWQATGLSSKT